MLALLRAYSPISVACVYSLSLLDFHTDHSQVAKSPVFSLGDDDDPIVVDGMLRHMYNLPYTDSLQSNDSDELFKLHVETFFLADKYDCPSLRRAAVSNFHDAATKALDSGRLILLNNTIATLCGPDARQTADISPYRSSELLRH